MLKQFLICFLLSFPLLVIGQNSQQHVSIRHIDKDSILLPLNADYYITGDSCTEIIRHCRYDFQNKILHGKFTDVSKINGTQVVSEGFYTNEGLKNGPFTIYYLSGQLMAKGSFKNGLFDGEWNVFYPDGTLKLSFVVIDGEFTINELNKPDGAKLVDKGNGMYIGEPVVGTLYWKGKLLNGKPEGKWNMFNADDISSTAISTEIFKKGTFKGGNTGDFNYDEKSHIIWISNQTLPILNGDKFAFASVACNGVKPGHIVGAQYQSGLSSFSVYISDVVSPYLRTVRLNNVHGIIVITGEVNENGVITKLKNEGGDDGSISRGIILQLMRLPVLHPATIDGKPTTQKFLITFKIDNNWYSFTYKFLPIQLAH